jgi:hypothetical protein
MIQHILHIFFIIFSIRKCYMSRYILHIILVLHIILHIMHMKLHILHITSILVLHILIYFFCKVKIWSLKK